ncbi:MAG: Asp-tRNA(Asn)/Glu-tRNA(Gln) amidotransferase subunit GatB [Candidatus Latescibacteria bacterium]|nr:Asp-tRNA(Asn)/Glu-tRNA(Gln) amidotransferase subunit GatB [Candidatus Latescibacterota bacterium]NIM22131.1 Asp-tRNA(Asn)/Glu-tRNA(Gln) amidotransferase subunit GatB [Candidatus Latescibacterota bacterium]NIM64681.1 Asp-tRNA(Asn)/Glu-tRNA(Gln) amidotransferase subunit GatB [Candidatus Latescibacterota bacterium]NIO01191.1 Asp-tRNA(Asn)/Glu-tRNA(Gln) amidotransferase subunit GatB [Candidatus Latescibacterota bacterium]NIO27576.1 Asp-tRNA(Asn)/Glu-tRNA(Gln) amidotransferase subunit GatB [Candi
MGKYEAIIGLEVHAQLLTKSKMFCACSTEFGGAPNTQVCPVCLGLPGALPVVNEKAVEYAVRMGLATNSKIAKNSVFARKNYFYPDCPKNYQISQYDTPLCSDGALYVGGRRIGIARIHLEEDAGKLIHCEDDNCSLVDMNRCGVPLVEVVSEPDIRTPEEASEYLQKLRSILRYLEICDGNMEEGSLRCDVNVSVRQEGSEWFGTRTEIKNLNSFKAVEQALHYEIGRQERILLEGGRVEHETLLWDSETGEARIMRSKEEAHDYRYFPEPDLLVLEVPGALMKRAKSAIPELPDAKEDRFVRDYNLPRYDAQVLTGSREIAGYFEAVEKALGDPKQASNWIMGEVLRELNERKIDISKFSVSAEDLADLIALQKSGKINMPTAKEIFREMVGTGGRAEKIIASKGLEQISNEKEIEQIVLKVLDAYPDEVSSYHAGKVKLLAFFIGQVMRETRGRTDPQKTASILKAVLEERR